MQKRDLLAIGGTWLLLVLGMGLVSVGTRSNDRGNCTRINDVRVESNQRAPQHRREARIIAETEGLLNQFVGAAALARQQSGDFRTAARYRAIQQQAATL